MLLRRLTAIAAATAATVLLAAPAGAGAARPVKGSFFNGSSANGLYAITTPHTIRTLQIYCADQRFSVQDLVSVGRSGNFSYHGNAYGYGDGGRPTGTFTIRISGRFTSPTRMKLKRSVKGCSTATVSATGTRD